MAKYKIRYARIAVDDLDSIFGYISEDNREAAKRMLDRIESAIAGLAENPRMGAVVLTGDLSFVEPGHRRIVVEPYMIFYRVGKEAIYIGRILHGRHDWMHLLAGWEFNVN